MLHPVRLSCLHAAPLLTALLVSACSGGGDTSSGTTSGPGGGSSASGGTGPGGGSTTASGGAGGVGGAGSGGTATTSTTTATGGSGGSATTTSGSGGMEVVVLADQYILPEDQFPESGTYDSAGHAFFASSLKYGDVWRVAADGTQGVFYPGNGEADRLTLGMKVDAAKHRLWVCSIVNDDTKPGTVWVVDTQSGDLLADFALGDTVSGASCNDLALDSQGRAYVTDRENPHVYRIDLDAGSVSVWASGPLLAPGTIGLNGIAFTPDGAHVIVTKYLPSKLVRISTAQPGQMAEVVLDGDAFSGGFKPANGADGVVFAGSSLYVAFGDNVMRVTPADATWASATVKAKNIGTGYTAVTVAQGELYAIRGHAVSFQFGLSPDLPFDILRVDLGAF